MGVRGQSIALVNEGWSQRQVAAKECRKVLCNELWKDSEKTQSNSSRKFETFIDEKYSFPVFYSVVFVYFCP
jgi:hypothetical protein